MSDKTKIAAAVDALLNAEGELLEHFNRRDLAERLRVWLKRMVICGRVEKQEREARDGG